MTDVGLPAPRFSVVVPAYNAEATLAETLDAVLAQRFDEWECVVVDDGSRDGTLQLAQDYAARDSRIRVVTQPNQGTAGAYNTGVSAATGAFIVLCSADDLLLPDHLAEVASHIDSHPACDIVSTNGFLLSPDGSTKLMYDPDWAPGSLSLADVIRACFYSVGATYRRGVFDLVGGYRVGVFGEDYDFWLRAMSRGAKHCFVPKALSMHRVTSTQKSANSEAALRSDIRLLRDLERSGALSGRERREVHDSVCGHLAHIAFMDPMPARRTLRRAVVYLSHPASLLRGLARRIQRRTGSSS